MQLLCRFAWSWDPSAPLTARTVCCRQAVSDPTTCPRYSTLSLACTGPKDTAGKSYETQTGGTGSAKRGMEIANTWTGLSWPGPFSLHLGRFWPGLSMPRHLNMVPLRFLRVGFAEGRAVTMLEMSGLSSVLRNEKPCAGVSYEFLGLGSGYWVSSFFPDLFLCSSPAYESLATPLNLSRAG